jgi:hypothetical protein
LNSGGEFYLAGSGAAGVLYPIIAPSRHAPRPQSHACQTALRIGSGIGNRETLAHSLLLSGNLAFSAPEFFSNGATNNNYE